MIFVYLSSLLLLTTVAAGCSAASLVYNLDIYNEYEQVNDPMEPANRLVFIGNQTIDTIFLSPMARWYRMLPQFVRNSVHNFLINLNEPLTFVHDSLQLEPKRAAETLLRFVFNTILGFFGINDITSSSLGIYSHSEDMGQTLAVWGLQSGPYIVLPLLGPSNWRDMLGRVTDFFLNPVSIFVSLPTTTNIGLIILEGIDQREHYLDVSADLERTSLDYYAALRTLYQQHRTEEINNGR